MFRIGHPAEADLMRLADSELKGAAASRLRLHLESCERCRARLEELKQASELYAVYQTRVLKRAVGEPEEWPQLLPPATKPVASKSWYSWAPVAAVVTLLCGITIIGALYYMRQPQRQMTRLLARAARVETPRDTRLQIAWNGRRWYRPAVLQSAKINRNEDEEADRARALFV